MSQKVNVYVVTSGDYDDYHIERVFLNLEDAEYYVAEQTDKRKHDPSSDIPKIEKWTANKNNNHEKVYKAIWFQVIGGIYGTRNLDWHMIYSLKPFHIDIEKNRKCPGSTFEMTFDGITGVIPTDITFDHDNLDDEVAVNQMVQNALTTWEENLL